MARQKPTLSENPPAAPDASAATIDPTQDAAPDDAAVQDDAPADVTAAECMPEASGRRDDASFELLIAACEVFNIDPRIDTRPRELAAWRFYPGNRVEGVDASVVLVTAGGLKVRYPIAGDAETEERLRNTFGAYTIDPKTKERVPAELPADLTLPASAVTGQVVERAHRHSGGYLRRARA